MEIKKSDEFLESLEYFEKKHNTLNIRIRKKVHQIIENPYHFKPLRNVLKNYRRAHIGSYVILYRIHENVLYLEKIAHHDFVY